VFIPHMLQEADDLIFLRDVREHVLVTRDRLLGRLAAAADDAVASRREVLGQIPSDALSSAGDERDRGRLHVVPSCRPRYSASEPIVRKGLDVSDIALSSMRLTGRPQASESFCSSSTRTETRPRESRRPEGPKRQVSTVNSSLVPCIAR